ncbi:hypothetical protein H6B11_04295 [Mediterraneibacter glycyrrhizinilyticus]|nr:hypothetical protein [Mediterraneibacter glycyrrhizinilyticus]MBM6853387.1 hypothetical protein [Mediterraneibacter glycyrrhizinilyticus]
MSWETGGNGIAFRLTVIYTGDMQPAEPEPVSGGAYVPAGVGWIERECPRQV